MVDFPVSYVRLLDIRYMSHLKSANASSSQPCVFSVAGQISCKRMAKSTRWWRRLSMITEPVFSFSSQLFTTAAHMFMSCVSPIALGSATFHCRVAHVLTSASRKWIGPDRCSKLKGLLALTLPMFAILSFWNWCLWCGTCLLIPMPIILCTHKKIHNHHQHFPAADQDVSGPKRQWHQTPWVPNDVVVPSQGNDRWHLEVLQISMHGMGCDTRGFQMMHVSCVQKIKNW